MSENANSNRGRILRNVVYGFSTWILPVALGFVATPVILRALGDEDYGIYALVLGFIAYSFNFNTGRAITKYIAEYRSSGEDERISAIVSATFFVSVVVGGAGFIILSLTARTLIADVMGIEPASQDKAVTAMRIAALTIFFLMINQVFMAVLQGIQRFDVFAKLNNIYNITLIAGNLALVLLGHRLTVLLGWNLLVTALSAITAGIFARRLLPEFRLGFGFGRDALRLVFGYSAWVIAYQILANILLLFERAWITYRLGPESLTHYVVPMTVAIYIHGFMSSLMLVIFPMASELQRDPERLLRLYLKATRAVLILVIFIGATLITLSNSFLTVWIDADFAARSGALLAVHAITFSLLSVNIATWQLSEGLGRPRYNTLLFLVCFIVTVAGMIGFTGEAGNFGAAISRMIGFGTMFIGIFIVEKLFFGRPQVGFWIKTVGLLILAAIPAIAAEILIDHLLGARWLALILSGAAGATLYFGIAWLLGVVTDDEKALILRRGGRGK